MDYEYVEEQQAIAEIKRVASIVEKSQPLWSQQLKTVAQMAEVGITLRRCYSHP